MLPSRPGGMRGKVSLGKVGAAPKEKPAGMTGGPSARAQELLKQFDGRGGDRSKTNGAVSSAHSDAEANHGHKPSPLQR
jgi:hypothetical protein